MANETRFILHPHKWVLENAVEKPGKWLFENLVLPPIVILAKRYIFTAPPELRPTEGWTVITSHPKIPDLVKGFLTVSEICALDKAHHAQKNNHLIQQLQSKKSLTIQQVCHYREALGLDENDWQGVLRYCLKLEKLECAVPTNEDAALYDDDFLQQLAPCLPPTLNTLHFSSRSMTDEGVIPFLEECSKRCPLLRDLSFLNTGITDASLSAIAKTSPQLTSIQAYGRNTSGKGMASLLEGCPHLQWMGIKTVAPLPDITMPMHLLDKPGRDELARFFKENS